MTGQHPNLDLAAYGLGDLRVVRLHQPGRAAPHRHVELVCEATLPTLRTRPDLMIVQGDTSSALGATLAAVRAGVPVAHVEAGLRTHDWTQPWPEEEYRRRIDAESALLFAPTDLAARNLRDENVRGAVHVTGNSGIDALLHVERTLPPSGHRESAGFNLLVTCHRRENWGAGFASVAQALMDLADDAQIRIDLILHPNSNLPDDLLGQLQQTPRIDLHPPCSHAELVRRMRDCDLLLSDSGGMQEEAPTLGVPMLVLRDKTERPEGIATGNMRLVGCRTGDIVQAVRELLTDPVALAAMARRNLPYGDGFAGPRIAAIVEDWLAQSARSQRRAV
jgi:UDP-N-acetylglucosamine 2-epimerase (non-hydrolysing)